MKIKSITFNPQQLEQLSKLGMPSKDVKALIKTADVLTEIEKKGFVLDKELHPKYPLGFDNENFSVTLFRSGKPVGLNDMPSLDIKEFGKNFICAFQKFVKKISEKTLVDNVTKEEFKMPKFDIEA